EKVKKKVPVLSQIQVELKKQYLIKEKIKFTPDSINISGPGQIIDTINNVFSKKRQYYEAEKTIQDEILLKKINGVSLSNNSVNFSLIIEEFTEGNIKVPLRVINMPDSVILRTFPNENTISFLVALSDFDKIIEPQFDAVVDYDEIAGKSKLKVHLLKYPDNIYSVKTKPEYVEYIIEK
ncbi:MAG: hypothetical protein U9R54_06460, partial [Bacteroidota bacterium]|nr:hypothetical protein [Bacteroidota bacterium]